MPNKPYLVEAAEQGSLDTGDKSIASLIKSIFEFQKNHGSVGNIDSLIWDDSRLFPLVKEMDGVEFARLQKIAEANGNVAKMGEYLGNASKGQGAKDSSGEVKPQYNIGGSVDLAMRVAAKIFLTFASRLSASEKSEFISDVSKGVEPKSFNDLKSGLNSMITSEATYLSTPGKGYVVDKHSESLDEDVELNKNTKKMEDKKEITPSRSVEVDEIRALANKYINDFIEQASISKATGERNTQQLDIYLDSLWQQMRSYDIAKEMEEEKKAKNPEYKSKSGDEVQDAGYKNFVDNKEVAYDQVIKAHNDKYPNNKVKLDKKNLPLILERFTKYLQGKIKDAISEHGEEIARPMMEALLEYVRKSHKDIQLQEGLFSVIASDVFGIVIAAPQDKTPKDPFTNDYNVVDKYFNGSKVYKYADNIDDPNTLQENKFYAIKITSESQYYMCKFLGQKSVPDKNNPNNKVVQYQFLDPRQLNVFGYTYEELTQATVHAQHILDLKPGVQEKIQGILGGLESTEVNQEIGVGDVVEYRRPSIEVKTEDINEIRKEMHKAPPVNAPKQRQPRPQVTQPQQGASSVITEQDLGVKAAMVVPESSAVTSLDEKKYQQQQVQKQEPVSENDSLLSDVDAKIELMKFLENKHPNAIKIQIDPNNKEKVNIVLFNNQYVPTNNGGAVIQVANKEVRGKPTPMYLVRWYDKVSDPSGMSIPTDKEVGVVGDTSEHDSMWHTKEMLYKLADSKKYEADKYKVFAKMVESNPNSEECDAEMIMQHYYGIFERNAHIQRIMYDNNSIAIDEGKFNDSLNQYLAMEVDACLEEYGKTIQELTLEEISEIIQKIDIKPITGGC